MFFLVSLKTPLPVPVNTRSENSEFKLASPKSVLDTWELKPKSLRAELPTRPNLTVFLFRQNFHRVSYITLS